MIIFPGEDRFTFDMLAQYETLLETTNPTTNPHTPVDNLLASSIDGTATLKLLYDKEDQELYFIFDITDTTFSGADGSTAMTIELG